MKIYRQGDVLLVQAAMPKEAQPAVVRQDKKIVLAFGEVTGHHHRIEQKTKEVPAILWDAGAERYLRVLGKNVELLHEEHSTVVLDPGDYLVVIQAEYTPQEFRRVID